MNRFEVLFENIEISCISNDQHGPSVVFLHGNSLSSMSFTEQFKDKSIQDFRLVGIDFPGHGYSQRAKNPAENYNLIYLSDAVLHVINHLHLDNFILAGHSLGGHVAMECLPYLKNCEGLIIWSAPPIKLPLNIPEIFLPHPSQGLLFQKDLSQRDLIQLAGLLADKKYQNDIIEMILQSDPEFREFLPVSLANQMVSDEYNLLTKSGLPVAILQGEHDQFINYDYYEKLEIPKLWRHEAIVIKNATHTPQLESPEEFNQILLQFISEVLKIN